MTVISRGKLPEERRYRPTCHRCKTVFEFTEGEGKVTHDQRDGSYVAVACPVCGTRVTTRLSDAL